MCNLYAITTNREALTAMVNTWNRPNLPELGYIGPKREAPIFRSSAEGIELNMVQWGFEREVDAKKTCVTNVRNVSSPFWKSMLATPERRCVVPATRFSEWTDRPDPVAGKRVMKWFDVPATPIFCFAGIWRPTPNGERFAFLTTSPNAVVGPIHARAMPVILEPADYERWLTVPDCEGACALQRQFPAERMRVCDEG